MKYRKLGRTGLELSVIGLGGHEFQEGGRIKGFQTDPKRAITAGVVLPDFGAQDRKDLVHAALDAGINLFDVTIDSEKEAMGRILANLPLSEPIHIRAANHNGSRGNRNGPTAAGKSTGGGTPGFGPGRPGHPRGGDENTGLQ